MDINDLNAGQLADLFGPKDGQAQTGFHNPVFGMSDDLVPADLFNPSTTQQTTLPVSTTDQTTQPVSTTDQTTRKPQDDASIDADILGGDAQGDQADKGKTGRPAKYDFSDMAGYIQDRQKKGKFVVVEEDGKPFVPKTPEDFDEVFDLQINHKLQERSKELEKNWYSTKSPAWQVISRYADLVDDPTEIIPFLQGVKTIQSVQGFDENEVEGAERIIRTRMLQNGDPEDLIQEQIEILKNGDKLIPTAKKYKPIIIQQEAQALQEQQRQALQQEQEYLQMVGNIRQNAIKAIEEPVFGKQKLKQEEKAMVYDLIAEPSQQSQGYGIFTAIDQLFEKGDFKKLTKLALFLAKEDAFNTYSGVEVANQTHTNLERKLRVAGETGSGSDGTNEEPVQTVQRNKFKQQPRFGFDA